MKKVLIIVDVQNDFVEGVLGSGQAQAIIPEIRKKILETDKYENNQIVFTRDTHGENYLKTQEGKNLPIEHCIEGTHGWEIYDSLDTKCKNCHHINKPNFGWSNWLESIGKYVDSETEIEIAGLVTEICVISNALILKSVFPENKIIVDSSACAGITEEKHKMAIEVMKSCQIEIIE